MKKHYKVSLLAITAISSFAIASSLTPEPALNTTSSGAEKFDKTAETTNFVLNGIEATDTDRKLIWQRCLVGQTFDSNSASCTGTATEFASWKEALDAVPVGWRMPNAKELASIVEETQAFPALNSTVFPFVHGLKYYTHAGTTETTDRTKPPTHRQYPEAVCVKVETTDYYGIPTTKYYLPTGYLDAYSQTDWARECTVPAKIPASYSVQLNAPYIWSATPVSAITASRSSWDTDESYAQKQQALEKFSYALDTADGALLTIAHRDGSAGDTYTDAHQEKKARYVLLVKDVS